LAGRVRAHAGDLGLGAGATRCDGMRSAGNVNRSASRSAVPFAVDRHGISIGMLPYTGEFLSGLDVLNLVNSSVLVAAVPEPPHGR